MKEIIILPSLITNDSTSFVCSLPFGSRIFNDLCCMQFSNEKFVSGHLFRLESGSINVLDLE